MRLIPVDFEAAEDWWGAMLDAGFDPTAKALVSSFQGLTRHDYVFRPALVLTDALAGHADDLV